MVVSRSLRERIAGQSAMSDVVLAFATAPQQGRLARFFGVSPLTPAGRLAHQDAVGELFVGDVLDNLGPTWDVLHDLPLGDTVLDHLVIGRAGVFAVQAVSALDREVVVDGAALYLASQPSDHIIGARVSADSAADLLSMAAGIAVPVQPVLVLVGPRRLTIVAPPSRVRVLASYQLEWALTAAVHTLDGPQVAAISDCADLATTWPDRGAANDIPELHREFALIRERVRNALLRRVLWGSLGIASLCLTVFALIAAFVSLVVAH